MTDEPAASSSTEPDPSDSLPTTEEILDALKKVASGQVPDRTTNVPASPAEDLGSEDEVHQT